MARQMPGNWQPTTTNHGKNVAVVYHSTRQMTRQLPLFPYFCECEPTIEGRGQTHGVKIAEPAENAVEGIERYRYRMVDVHASRYRQAIQTVRSVSLNGKPHIRLSSSTQCNIRKIYLEKVDC